ncbi:SDR family oxidoreductase [Actinophytocola oryzae]|uniref:3-oxoacyl-[acyl-carrier protein] reductase n=1 Tax=Actinophytocola oryzae TaxID=502181 RepID=A0A4R7UVY2_9PSEU|nr:SDR family oxidoreductase [Actinophytocola oryzae]TDV37755.1 3-oxoacyl-[acyl-carrier protein] reductase [Actinophytocola oryzae]
MSVALVTGAGRGLGAAIATELGARGHHVIVNYRSDAESARAVAEGIGTAVRADVTDPRDVDRLVARVVDDHGRIDVLVVNANTAPPPFASLVDLTWEAFAAKVDGELAGAFHVTKRVLGVMRAGGRIVYVGSTAADYVGGGRLAHGVAKNALAVFARHVAAETARHGITVVTVAPGAVRTAASEHVLTADRARHLAEHSVLGRVLEPVDVARAVAVVAGEELRPATGSTIRLDAGWSVLVGGPTS